MKLFHETTFDRHDSKPHRSTVPNSTMKVLLFVFLFAAPLLGQPLKHEYTKSDDTSMVSARTRLNLVGPGAALFQAAALDAGFLHNSEQLRSDVQYFYLSVIVGGSNFSSLSRNKLVLLADGRTISTPSFRSDQSVIQSEEIPTLEILHFRITRGEMNLLANAKSVQMQLGTVKAFLTTEQIRLLSALFRAGTVASAKNISDYLKQQKLDIY